MGRPPKVAPPPVKMTPAEIRAARETLGHMWGLGQPISARDLANVMRIGYASICAVEAGKSTPSGPFCVALRMMLAGAHPPDMLKILRL